MGGNRRLMFALAFLIKAAFDGNAICGPRLQEQRGAQGREKAAFLMRKPAISSTLSVSTSEGRPEHERFVHSVPLLTTNTNAAGAHGMYEATFS
jgi:hypothetical protein